MRRTIKLLGEPAIMDADAESQPVRGYQTWALLARVVLSRVPLDRRTLSSELFPEAADPLGALRWCLASLRSALDTTECLRGDPIERDFAADIAIDVQQLEAEDFDIEAAGLLLGSIEPRCSPEFATWLLVERERLASIVGARIRRETIKAIAQAHPERAVRLAELGVRRDAFDEGAQILLVKGLVLAGRYETALQHVDAVEALFLAELGQRPSPALRSAARRTIAAPPGGIPPGVFVRTLIRSGLAALAAGALDAGVESLRRAVSDAEKLADDCLTAEAMFELGTALVHSVRGYDDEGSIVLRSCAELAQRCGAADLASSAYRELGYVEALAGRRPAAAVYLASAVELATSQDNISGIHAVYGFNLVDWGRIDEGMAHFEKALEHARWSGNRRREMWAYGLGSWGHLAAGRLEEADRWSSRSLQQVDEQGYIAFRPWPVVVLNEVRLRRGENPGALRPELGEAYALSSQLGDACWEAASARVMALSYAAENDFGPAMEWIHRARTRCVRNTDSFVGLEVEILASEVEIKVRQNKLDAAEPVAREWIALAARSHMDAHVARAAKFIAGG